MRRTALAVLPLAAFATLAAVPSHASTAPLSFTTTPLAGSTGRSEPRVAWGPNHTFWLTTNLANGDEVVYRSTDGTSWTRVTTPPGQTNPTTDVDVVTMKTGRVLTSELDFAGINFVTAYTDDRGKTWRSSQGTQYADTDRQWFAVGPPSSPDKLPRVYLLFHNLLTGEANHNMFVATSDDGGATFGVPVPVTLPPEQAYLDLQCADSGGPSSIDVDQKTGRVYVVFGTRSSPAGGCAASPPEVNVVAATRVWVVSADASKTATPGGWTASLAVDDSASGRVVGMQLADGAIDDAGNVYVAYPESPKAYPDYDGAAIRLVRSTDHGLHWSKPFTIAAAGGTGNILPLVVAGDRGKLGFTWFHGLRDKSWVVEAAVVPDALSAFPHVSTVQVSDVVVETGTASSLMGACGSGAAATLNGFTCGRSTDVNGIAIDNCGRLMLAWPAQARGSQDATFASYERTGPRIRSTRC